MTLTVLFLTGLTTSATSYAPVITIDQDLISASGHDKCEWYLRYPYNDAGTGNAPAQCMSDDQCTVFNAKACSRYGATAYATIARLPLAFHLNHDFENIFGWGSGLSGWHKYERDASEPWPDAHITVDVSAAQRKYWKKIDSAAHETNVCVYDLNSDFNGGFNGNLENSACLRVEDIQELISDVSFDNTVTCDSCYSGASVVGPDANCLGIPGMRDDDGRVCDPNDKSSGSSYQPYGGRHASCLLNAQSISMRICQLDKVCINKAWVEAQDPPLIEEYTQNENDGIVPKINKVALKTPQTDDAFFRIYEDNVDCSGTSTRDILQYSGTSSGSALLDLNTQSAMLIIQSPYTCSCRLSATEEGNTLRYDQYDANSGLHRCMPCEEASSNSYVGYYRGPDQNQGQSLCFPQISTLKCLQCATNNYYNPVTKRCEACPVFRPKRNNFVDNPGETAYDRECTTCSAGQWFNTGATPSQCESVDTIQLNGDGTLRNNDHYHSNVNDLTKNGYTAVPFGNFLQISYAQEYNSVACECEDEFQFPQWCGAHEIPGIPGHLSRNVYVQAKIDGIDQVGLWSDVYDETGWEAPTILRRGVCTDCNECSLHYYNQDCGDNFITAGSCTSCKDPTVSDESSCNVNQYFNHTSEMGCVQTRARSDYFCEDCKYADYDAEIDSAELWIGCGLRTSVTWWTNVGTEQTCDYASSSGSNCKWTNPSDDVEYEFSNTRNAALDSLEFLGVRGQGLKIPYCPLQYHVKQECVDDSESFSSLPYQPDCCVPCLAQPDAARKTAAWVECTGYTVQDTQAAGYTNDCPAQTYTDEKSTPAHFEDDECKACTTCPGQYIV